MITSSFKHAVSDIFMIFFIMFSERAPLEMTDVYIVSESNLRRGELRGSEATKWGCPSPRAGIIFAFLHY